MTYPKLAALAVVVRKQKLLLARRKNEPDADLRGLPGGHVDVGEGVGETACRELLEETTVGAEPARTLIGLDTIIPDTRGRTAFHYYLVTVECAYVSGEPQARYDVYGMRWGAHHDVFEGRIPSVKMLTRCSDWLSGTKLQKAKYEENGSY